MDRIIEYLKGKEEISLPDLQADLGMSYRELISTHQMLSRRGYVSEKIDGIRVKVNSRYVSPIEFGDDDIREFLGNLQTDELYMLRRIDGIFTDEDDVPEFENLSSCNGIECLIKLNVVHEFEGKHYPSITKSAYERIKKMIRYGLDDDDDYSNTAAAIGYPILMRWIEDSDTAYEIMSLPYIPEEARDYVQEKLDVYELTGKLPMPPKEERTRLLKYEIIESFIDQCFFFTKAEYNVEAKQTLEMIKKCDIFSDGVISAMERATEEIVDDLTLGNIFEIRKLNGKFGIPDDD